MRKQNLVVFHALFSDVHLSKVSNR